MGTYKKKSDPTREAETDTFCSEQVIDDRFYSHMTTLMVASNPIALDSGPQTSYRTFLYDMPDAAFRETFGHDKPQNNARITLLEEQIAIQGGTTGLRTW